MKKSRKWMMIKQSRSEGNPVVESPNHDTLFCLNWVKQSELVHSSAALGWCNVEYLMLHLCDSICITVQNTHKDGFKTL